MSALAGGVADPGQYNTDIRKLVARARTTANSPTTTTEAGVLRLDGVAVKAGRIYLVTTNSVGVDTSVANDGARLNLRYTTDGSTATTSSTVLELAQWKLPDAAHSENFVASVLYAPGADQALSILLCIARSGGSGSIGVVADPTFPAELLVWDLGVDPGNTGVVL